MTSYEKTIDALRAGRLEDLGGALAALRERARLLPEDVAADCGKRGAAVSVARVRAWEGGVLLPSIKELAAVLATLGASLAELFVELSRVAWRKARAQGAHACRAVAVAWRHTPLERALVLLAQRMENAPEDCGALWELAQAVVRVEVLTALLAEERTQLDERVFERVTLDQRAGFAHSEAAGRQAADWGEQLLSQLGELRGRVQAEHGRLLALHVDGLGELERRDELVFTVPCRLGFWRVLHLAELFGLERFRREIPAEQEREVWRQWSLLLAVLAGWEERSGGRSAAFYHRAAGLAFEAVEGEVHPAEPGGAAVLAVELRKTHRRFRREHRGLAEATYRFAPEMLVRVLSLAAVTPGTSLTLSDGVH